jgi:hypothetical protein
MKRVQHAHCCYISRYTTTARYCITHTGSASVHVHTNQHLLVTPQQQLLCVWGLQDRSSSLVTAVQLQL